ncbi:uncharacterized protein BT62DRAFT_1025730, partial [Guyanagaster necrorhizus]
MSSIASVVARALSPVPDVFSVAGGLDIQSDHAAVARRAALQGARTVDGLIDLIPGDFVEVLREPLRGIAGTTNKLCSARLTLVKWEAHKKAGTMPAHLFRQAPEVQLTADFGSSPDALMHRKNLEDAHKAYLAGLLDSALAAKRDDIRFLEAALTPEKLYERLSPIVIEHGQVVLRNRRVANIKFSADNKVEGLTWVEDAQKVAECKNLLADVVVYAFRVISIVELASHATSAKQDRKKALAKAADVEMADATRAGPSIQSMVDRAVAARLKQVDRKPGRKSV